LRGRHRKILGSVGLAFADAGHQRYSLEVQHLAKCLPLGAEAVILWAGIGPDLQDIPTLAFLKGLLPQFFPYSGRRISKENPSLGFDQPAR